jgi:hypothetical protein
MNQPGDTTGSKPATGTPRGTARRYALAEGVTFQPMGEDEDTVVLSLSQGQLFTCNGTATDFLVAMQDGLTLDQAADRLVEAYGIERAVAEADLVELAATLLAEGLLVELD